MPLPRNSEHEMVGNLLSSDIGDIFIVDRMVNDYERLEGEGKITEAIGKLREALKYCEKYKIICDNVKETAGVKDEWNVTIDLLDKIYKGLEDKIRSGIPPLEEWKEALSEHDYEVDKLDDLANKKFKDGEMRAETLIKYIRLDIIKFMKNGTYYNDMISYLNEKLNRIKWVEDYANDIRSSIMEGHSSGLYGGGKKIKRKKSKKRKSKRRKNSKRKSKKK
jgi:hypothetical protein